MTENPSDTRALDATDRSIINTLQTGLPICERPYAAAAGRLGITEEVLLSRLSRLRDQGFISRLGPMFHAEKLGGGLTLAAMQVPDDAYEKVSTQVNTYTEVAHNYRRNHVFNMWFVLATETPEEIENVLVSIAEETGYPVFNMPKQEEFFIGLKLEI